MPLEIAQEILDFIVDYLHDDPTTLRSCSLTSKSLLDPSYHHLFGTLNVKLTDEWIQHHIRHRRWDDFLAWVTSEPIAVKYVRRLRLGMGDPPSNTAYGRNTYKELPVLTLQDIIKVIRDFPLLEHLELHHIHIDEFEYALSTHANEDSPRPLSSLSLCSCAFDDLALALPNTLRAIKSTRVTLHRLQCTVLPFVAQGSFGEQAALSQAPSLHRDILPDYLLHIQNLQIICAFGPRCSPHDKQLFSMMPGLTPQIYPSLREFSLLGWGWLDGRNFRTASIILSLQNATNLRSVTIGISSLDSRFRPHSKHDTQYLSLLESLPLSVEYIRVDHMALIGDNVEIGTKLPDSNHLCNVLSRLPALRSFTFRWGLREQDWGIGIDKILSDQVSRLSPNMAKNGILRSECCSLESLYRSTGPVRTSDLDGLFRQ